MGTSGDYVVIQQNMMGSGIGHMVVIVGYDPLKGFKIKSSDENSGTVEWIPLSRMTWYQAIVTEDKYKMAQFYNPATNSWNVDQRLVENALTLTHQKETGDVLATDFKQRKNVYLLNDFGFVLKFKKTCQCKGDTCKHTLVKYEDGDVTVVKFE